MIFTVQLHMTNVIQSLYMMQQSSSESLSLEDEESERSLASSAKLLYMSTIAAYLALNRAFLSRSIAFPSLKMVNFALAASLRSSLSDAKASTIAQSSSKASLA